MDPNAVSIFSTDTVYGLGTGISNAAGIERIYQVKGRDRTKPLAILVADLAQADDLIEWPTPLYRDVLEQLWPGALTVVGRSLPSVPEAIRQGFLTVGLRCPKHAWLQAVLKKTGPWVATSVNRSGQEPLGDEAQIRTEFSKEVDAFYFEGPTPNGAASTVIDLSEFPPKILRAGPVPLDAFAAL